MKGIHSVRQALAAYERDTLCEKVIHCLLNRYTMCERDTLCVISACRL